MGNSCTNICQSTHSAAPTPAAELVSKPKPQFDSEIGIKSITKIQAFLRGTQARSRLPALKREAQRKSIEDYFVDDPTLEYSSEILGSSG